MTATLEDPSTTETPYGAGATPSEPPSQSRPVPASLAPWHDPHPWVGRLMALAALVLAGFTRFWALGFPPGRNLIPQNGMNFDEIYYATEAQEMLRYGYADNRGYMFIVHPPLGKWLIGGTEWLQGAISGDHSSTAYLSNSLGWRIAPALFGCIGVILLMRTVRRMMRSNLFGGIAGLLMALEGMSLVLARTAILDIFLQTFIIAGFGALVIDRDRMRARLAGLIESGVDLGDRIPTLGPRPWRVAGGVLLGLAVATKWTGAFFLIFLLLSWLWDRSAFKAAGIRRPMKPWLRRSVLPGLGATFVAPMATYLFTWLGWFVGENSWNRHWADTHTATAKILGVGVNFGWIPAPIRSLAQYHYQAYQFHVGLDSPHAYGSKPWSWLVLGRPVDFYYNGAGTTCGSSSCSREILLIGTPIMWWAFVPMLLWLAWHWFTTRDWRAGAVWIAFIVGWLFWFSDLSRTMFLFYMAPLVPFLIIGLTLALGVMLGPSVAHGRRDPRPRTQADLRALRRRRWGAAAVGGYLGLVVVDFAWMWPLFTGGLLTYSDWHAHMWLPSWI